MVKRRHPLMTRCESLCRDFASRLGLVAWRRRRRRGQGADAALMQVEMAETMRPVVRGYLWALCFYYLLNGLTYRVPGDYGLVPALALISVVVGGFLLRYTYRTQSMKRLEIAGHAANFLLFVNTAIDIALVYDPLKLIYFALLLPIFAISGASPRVALPGVIVSVTTFTTIAASRHPSDMEQYAWIAITALSTAMCMSILLRATILRAVRARVMADRHRDEASALAHNDALTGLPNRRSFFGVLDETLRAGTPFDLGLIDLDGFKPVNDVYGHAAGDAVLVEVGRRVCEVCEGGVVARLGGDEFALILPGGRNDAALFALGGRICDSLNKPFHLGAATTALSGSVGFVRHNGDSTLNGSQLIERADYALYRAKATRDCTIIFDSEHESEMRDFGRVDAALRSGNLDSEMHIVFQPQYDLQERRTVSFEALARWNSPHLGHVTPDIFIRAAERSGLIGDLTYILLKKTLDAVREWPEDLLVAFNLSVRDLHSPQDIERICEIVETSGVAPERIEFEITETAMLTDFDQALEGLTALKTMGARIALDDFGSGYSSFSYLHRLPVDTLKIDRSFVTQIVQNAQTRKIIKTMIDLCSNLDMDHVLEGVETEAELDLLREVNVRYVQGYLFGRPMAPEKVAAYLDAERASIEPLRHAS